MKHDEGCEVVDSRGTRKGRRASICCKDGIRVEKDGESKKNRPELGKKKKAGFGKDTEWEFEISGQL